MLTSTERAQYSRHILLEEIGEAGQEKLKRARVLVVGAGGLGCPALQYLAAAGVGYIGIIDGDKVERSNLPRQTLFTENDLGESKAHVAARRLKQMNSHIQVQAFYERLSDQNALSLFAEFDLIVEGSDSFITKYLVNDAAVLNKKPFVLASLSKFEGQLSTFNVQNGPTYRCLFPEPLSPEAMPTCSEVGVLGVLPGVMGSLMANEALKLLLGIGESLSGKLLLLDMLTMEHQLVQFQKVPAIKITTLKEINFPCSTATSITSITYEEYKRQKGKYSLLDVRTSRERQVKTIGGLHIPLKTIESEAIDLPEGGPWVVYCASGIRSLKAIEILQKRFPGKTFLNLKGGVS